MRRERTKQNHARKQWRVLADTSGATAIMVAIVLSIVILGAMYGLSASNLAVQQQVASLRVLIARNQVADMIRSYSLAPATLRESTAAISIYPENEILAGCFTGAVGLPPCLHESSLPITIIHPLVQPGASPTPITGPASRPARYDTLGSLCTDPASTQSACPIEATSEVYVECPTQVYPSPTPSGTPCTPDRTVVQVNYEVKVFGGAQHRNQGLSGTLAAKKWSSAPTHAGLVLGVTGITAPTAPP